MDNVLYGILNQSLTFLQPIPQSASGDAVTVEIRKQSNGHYWNFSTLAFQAGSTSGSMVSQAGEWWRQSFTPDAAGIYFITINDTTLDVKYYITVIVQGVTAGSVSGALTTLANVKVFLGITNTNSDTILNELISKISAECELITSRKLIAAAFTEYFDGDRRDTFRLRNFPINSITSIHDDYGRDYGADTLVPSDDYTFDADDGIVKIDYQTGRGRNNVKIVYNGGYSTTPQDLELAAKLLICALFLELKSEINTQEGQDVISSRADNIREQAMEILGRYKSYALAD